MGTKTITTGASTAVIALLTLAGFAPAYAASVDLPPVSVGAGARASFVSVSPDNGDDIRDFSLDTVRLYVNGSVTENIKFTFNTDYSSADSKLTAIDAIARFEFSDKFNIWAGRFLPPSDRANLYGPYYSNAYNFAIDGVQDGFPFYAAGRNNGVAYWGDFNRLKISLGAFDVPSTEGSDDIVTAARLHLSLWDIEKGYYLNGTYYGGKDVLSIGLAGHSMSGDTALTADLLMEKKMGGGGVFTLEAEFASYDGFGGYGLPGGGFESSEGGFALLSYLLPAQMGIGKLQLLGKVANTTFDTAGGDVDLETVEINLNYIISAFNARLSLFMTDQSLDGGGFSGDGTTTIGLGLQVQI